MVVVVWGALQAVSRRASVRVVIVCLRCMISLW